MEGLTVLLVVVAVIAGLIGLLFSSEATAGVAIISFACLLAIFARISQAAAQHQKK